MWLLRASSVLARIATRTYYDFTSHGSSPPRCGPVLLVANHPNSLVDAIVVSAVAGRGVRYLAKAPLFEMARIGWLLRAAGAIPIHRRVDNPEDLGQNVHAFEAVFEALSSGSAVGIFPEGVSHSEPALARLKTGAARMALGFADRHKRTFPIVPVGIILRDKTRFRSETAAFLGPQVAWEDLADRNSEDREAVRKLTSRIDSGLRQVTINLERWEDEPLVRCVAEIWEAEVDPNADPRTRLVRIRATTDALARLRRSGHQEWGPLAASIENHRRRLERLGLTPRFLRSPTDLSTALRWTLHRLHILFPVTFAVAGVGAILYWPVYRLTGRLARFAPPVADVQSTYKLLIGMVLYPLWTLLAAGVAWRFHGPLLASSVLLGMPIVAVAGLWIREAWRNAWTDARRYFTLRSRKALAEALARRQSELAKRLRGLWESLA
jgi:glycerol-3-phosphate O-acyltransferase/dihydroxyacetone phosphate acyltransferase